MATQKQKHKSLKNLFLNPASPEKYPKRILIIVCGLTPQVVTECIHGLINSDKPFIPTKVVIITTQMGLTDKGGLDDKLGNECRYESCIEDLVKRKIPNVTKDSLEHLTYKNIIKHIVTVNDKPCDDVHNEASLLSLGNLLVEVLVKYCSDDNSAVNVNIAGGRKSMSYLAGLALTLCGRFQDRLSHVIISEPLLENDPSFFYPDILTNNYYVLENDGNEQAIPAASVKIMLAQIPFICTNQLLVKNQILTTNQIAKKKNILESLVEEINNAIYTDEIPKVIFNTRNGICACNGIKIDFAPNELQTYYAICKLHLLGKYLTAQPTDEMCEDFTKYAKIITPGGSNHDKRPIDEITKIEDSLTGKSQNIFGGNQGFNLSDLKNSDDKDALIKARNKFFSPRRTDANKRLKSALGRLLCQKFEILSVGKNPSSYQLVDNIEITFEDDLPRQ